ncbi:hypothetical protein [Rhodomicrobium sp.]|uniref:hypothetical protein n=1 Tax=Rhodomicrobium sp. TaxID=2720632 RepID=UPI0039E5C8E3
MRNSQVKVAHLKLLDAQSKFHEEDGRLPGYQDVVRATKELFKAEPQNSAEALAALLHVVENINRLESDALDPYLVGAIGQGLVDDIEIVTAALRFAVDHIKRATVAPIAGFDYHPDEIESIEKVLGGNSLAA